MNQYHVEFRSTEGQQPRRFEVRFGMLAARELHKQFARPLRDLFLRDVLGADELGRVTRSWDPQVQLSVIASGIAGGGTPVAVERVAAWIDDHIARGGDLMEIVTPVTKAAFYAGIVTGRSQDLDAQAEQEEGRGKGKARTPPAVPAGD